MGDKAPSIQIYLKAILEVKIWTIQTEIHRSQYISIGTTNIYFYNLKKKIFSILLDLYTIQRI